MPRPPKLLLASHNPGKQRELDRILAPLVPGLSLLGLDDLPEYPEPAETEPTFEGNAVLKARAGARATGIATVADDSGLCVEVLNGMPGVRSARWAGPASNDRANNELLLAQLDDVPDQRRGAVFRCVVALCLPDCSVLTATGEMPGRIIREMRGSNGFGYDVVFEPAGLDVTSAELDATTKDRLSHRGKALRAIAPEVAAALGFG